MIELKFKIELISLLYLYVSRNQMNIPKITKSKSNKGFKFEYTCFTSQLELH